MPDIFAYLDYRRFLRDYYRYRKEKGAFSYRNFAKRAGLGAPNYLKLVIDGQRNLSREMATRFAVTCGLEGLAKRYFEDLVRFCQASTPEEQELAFAKLNTNRAYRQARYLDAQHADYHGAWYIPAVRELAACRDFRAEPAWIARRMRPAIGEGEAAHALEVLFGLGMLVRCEGPTPGANSGSALGPAEGNPAEDNPAEGKGEVRQREAILTTGPEMHAYHIARYHRMMLKRAAASIDLIPSQERDISALTLAVGAAGLQQIKAKIVKFREELLATAAAEQDATQVVQLNMQLFPLSQEDV